MKIARIQTPSGPRWARLDESNATLLSAAPWKGGAQTAEQVPLASAKLLAPYEGTKIVCIGRNYHEHAAEFGNTAPTEPMFFLKSPSCLVDPEGQIELPSLTNRIDLETELVVVIGKSARRVSEADALSYVYGYTIGNDVSHRDQQKGDLPFGFGRAKNYETFCPLGPWIVTGLDPLSLKIEARQNGEVRQSSSTALMVHNVPKLISFLSHLHTLEPGDLIMTGTPSGVCPLKPGDKLELTVEGIGTLTNYVIAPTV